MGFTQRDFVQITLTPGCDRQHDPAEDGQHGRIIFHETGTDHQFSVLYRTAADEPAEPFAKRVLGYYGENELVAATATT